MTSLIINQMDVRPKIRSSPRCQFKYRYSISVNLPILMKERFHYTYPILNLLKHFTQKIQVYIQTSPILCNKVLTLLKYQLFLQADFNNIDSLSEHFLN